MIKCSIWQKIKYTLSPGPRVEVYRSIFNKLFKNFIGEIINRVVAGETIDISLDLLCQWIKNQTIDIQEPSSYGLPTAEAVVADVKNPETIKSFFSFDQCGTSKISLGVLAQLNEERFEQTCTEGKQNGDRIRLDGEWLNNLEIEELYNRLQTPEYAHLKDVPLSTLFWPRIRFFCRGY